MHYQQRPLGYFKRGCECGLLMRAARSISKVTGNNHRSTLITDACSGACGGRRKGVLRMWGAQFPGYQPAHPPAVLSRSSAARADTAHLSCAHSPRIPLSGAAPPRRRRGPPQTRGGRTRARHAARRPPGRLAAAAAFTAGPGTTSARRRGPEPGRRPGLSGVGCRDPGRAASSNSDQTQIMIRVATGPALCGRRGLPEPEPGVAKSIADPPDGGRFARLGRAPPPPRIPPAGQRRSSSTIAGTGPGPVTSERMYIRVTGPGRTAGPYTTECRDGAAGRRREIGTSSSLAGAV
jgi:hypothetical protein